MRNRQNAFTLVELLIALTLLGGIATFTIPKILSSQASSGYKEKARQAAAMVSNAYQRYQVDTGATSSTTIGAFTSFMNYVAADTSTPLDSVQTSTNYNCSATNPCLKLHNGAMLHYMSHSFGGVATTNALAFHVDPDGVLTDGTTNSAGKSVPFFLYYSSGRVTDEGSITTGTANSSGTYTVNAAKVPPWFSWD